MYPSPVPFFNRIVVKAREVLVVPVDEERGPWHLLPPVEYLLVALI